MKKLIFLFFALFLMTEFSYAQYPRKIVFENFTNLGCGSCLLAGNSVNPWIKNHKEIIPITYHAGFPSGSDTMYLYAKEQISHRLSKYYKTPFVPFGRIMGIPVPHPEYTGHPADTNKINEYIRDIAMESSFKIDINYYHKDLAGKVDVKIIGDKTIPNLKLFLIIVEDHHYYEQAGLNGEKDFYNLMRAFVPDVTGLSINLNANNEFSYFGNYQLKPGVTDDVRVVAIIQDSVTKEIVQAETAYPSITSIYEQKSDGVIVNEQASEFLIKSPSNIINNIKIYDLFGNIIIQKQNDFATETMLIEKPIISGIYFLEINSGNEIVRKKITITR